LLKASGEVPPGKLRFGEIEFKPRLFFYDRDLWEIALKLKSQVKPGPPMYRSNTPKRSASC